ncbi:unnamed protein product, partial [marine sediment metagenome]
ETGATGASGIQGIQGIQGETGETGASGTTDHGLLIGLGDDDHTQYARTDGARNITGQQTYESNVVIQGNLIVSGTEFITETETVQIADNLMLINYGEVGAGVTAGEAGIEIDRGSETNYRFMFDEANDHFEVGVSGSEQAVATREDAPTDNYVTWWDDGNSRLSTSGSMDIGTVGTMSNVVEDTTPQLGGDLDTNGSDILFGTDTISGTGTIVTGDHSTVSGVSEVVNVVYGTGDAPPASTTTIGTLFIKYIP